MLKGFLRKNKSHILKKGLAFVLSLGMFLNGIPLDAPGTGRLSDVYAQETTATASNALPEDGELENDLSDGENMYSDTMYENKIVFSGIDSKVFVPGEEIHLLEGVSASVPGMDYRVTVRVVEIKDSNGRYYPNGSRFRVPETENVTYSVKYMAYIKKDELVQIGNVRFATPSNAATSLRRTSGTAATSAGLPVGGFIYLASVTVGSGNERLNVDNQRTGNEFTYTDISVSGKVSVDATISGVDLPGAYTLLRVPTKHLDKTVLNASTGEIAGLRINNSSLIQNNTIRFTREIYNGEDHIVAKIFFNDLKRTTAGDFPYNIKFADDRMTPSDYILRTEAEFFNGNGQSIGTSPIAEFKPLYDPQKITKYAMSNSNEAFSSVNQLLYGGPTLNNVIQEATAVNVPFMFNLQTKDPLVSYSRPNLIYRQRLIEKIVLEETLPLYNNELLGVPNFPAVFDPAANPDWTVTEYDAAGRPTKVRREVLSTSNDRLTGGADAVLKDSVVLNLKFPGLNTNVKTVSGLRVSGDQINNIRATLIPYGATAAELVDPMLVISDDLVFNLMPNESGAGMIGKRNIEASIPIETGFMHMDAKGANFIINYVNKRSVPADTLRLYDFKADPRMYYKEIEFRSNEGDIGGDKVLEIWGIDAAKQRTHLLYSRGSGPALPAATGVNPHAQNIQSAKLPLDSAVTNQIRAMVQSVESGAVAAENTTPVNKTFEGIEVVYDTPIPAFASASFRIHLGFRDPYHVKMDNPDALIENSAAFKAEYNVNGSNTVLEGEVQRNLTRLIRLDEEISLTKSTVANTSGNINELPLYRINLNFTKMANSRVFRNPKIIELLPFGMEYVGIFNTTRTNVNDVDIIPNYKDSGRTAVILSLDDIVVDGFPIISGRKWLQVQVRTKIVNGMFPDPAAALEANRNYAYFTADNLYPMSADVRVPEQSTPNAAGEMFGLTDDVYDIDGNPASRRVLFASSRTKVNVGGQIVSYKQIRNTGGDWIPSGNTGLNALDGIVTRFDEEFEYRINTENKTSGSNSGYAVYDILPYLGDQPYTGSANPRGSAFRNRLQGPLVAVAGTPAQDFVIMYSTNPSPNPDAVAAMTDPAMDWKTDAQIANWEDVTAIKINLAPGSVLGHSSIFRFSAPMKAPTLPADPDEARQLFLKKAVNLFQVSYSYDTPTKSFASSNTVFNRLGRNVSVRKVWAGADPNTPITVQLKQNGQDFSSDLYPNGQITLLPANHYQGVFERIPPSDGNGNRYTYTLEEVGIGSGTLVNYSAVITGDDETGFTVRNIEKKDITVKKIWQDSGFTQLTRPQSIQVQLKRSTPGGAAADVPGGLATLSGATDTWEHTYSALPVADDSGNLYTYSVEELPNAALRNYGTPVVTDVSETEKTITNTLVLRDLPVKKIWRNDTGLGTRPAALTVKVFRGATLVDQAVLSGSSDTWTHTFQNLLKYDMAGNEIAYTLQEEAIGLNNYLQAPAVTETDGSMTLVNTFVPFAVRAVVDWVDDNNSLQTRPSGVRITLQRSEDGGATFVDVPGETDRVVDASTGFIHDYQNVAKYSLNNVEYVYRIVQADNVNLRNYPNDATHRVYSSDTSGNVKQFKITNIYHTTAIQGTKVWVELGSAFTRPGHLNIQLFRNNDTSAAFRSRQITSLDADPLNPNRWLYRFDNLPVYDQNGDAYTYSVAEETVPAFYMAVVNGFEITNTYPRDTEIKVKKIWDHGVLPQRFQPTAATFELLRDNIVFDSITLHAANAAVHQWEHTFRIGESNARGHSFTVREADIPNYTAAYANTGVNETTITNTYTPVPVEVRLTGQKNVTGKYIPENELYRFVLEPVGDAIMPGGHTGALEMQSLRGAFDFGAIRFSYPGEFKYRIREINTGAEGFTYDGSIYDVVVSVDQQVQGLAANVRYTKNGVSAATAEFNNTYIPPLGDLVFWNRVRGRNTMYNNDYELKIVFEDDGVFHYEGAKSGSFSKEMTISLKRNKRVTIKDIPVGMKYKVELVTANGQLTENPLNEGKIVKGLNQVEVVHFEIRDRSSRVVGGGARMSEGGPGTTLSPVVVDDYFEDEHASNEEQTTAPAAPVDVVRKTTSKEGSSRVTRDVRRGVPNTGDNANLAIFGGILVLALGGFLFVGICRKKEEGEK